MPKRAKSTLRKGQVVKINGKLPLAVGDHAVVGDIGVIQGRYKPNCWPYHEVYMMYNRRSQIEHVIHVDYIDRH